MANSPEPQGTKNQTTFALMEIVRLSKPDRILRGEILLDGSKSLSNRALIALALAGADPRPWLSHLSTSRDTQTLQELLQTPRANYDAGDAGTTFRFLTAYLALQPGEQTLTGSARMCERPIGALVQALRQLGADIEYLEKAGYPPLKIGAPSHLGKQNSQVRINAGVSSQFLSALLLIGPYLPKGLELIPEGKLVSRPYLDMTMELMRYFGAQVAWQGDTILVQPGAYQARSLWVEADWSAASYWYAMAAFAEEVDLSLVGLLEESWQGDSVVWEWLPSFDPTPNPSPGGEGGLPSINLKFERGVEISRSNNLNLDRGNRILPSDNFKFDRGQAPLPAGGGVGGGVELGGLNLLNTPDLAQTQAIIHAGLGIPATFSGLETLAIKETDRTAALSAELAKVGVQFVPDNPERSRWRIQGKAQWTKPPRFATYGDHRMAMAFAPLAMFGPIEIENPGVVAKSYPAFWEQLEQVGFVVEKFTAP